MKILMLTPYLPYPLLSGGQIRTYNLLKKLAKNHDITLFALIKDREENEYVQELEKYCKVVRVFKRSTKPFTLSNIFKTAFSSFPFLVIRNNVPEVVDAVKKELHTNHYDLIHSETFYMMPHIPKTKVPILLVEQTIEYLGYESYAKKAPFFIRPFLNIDIKKIKRWEKYYWQKCSQLIVMSTDDKELISKQGVSSDKITVVENGVDIQWFNQKPRNEDPKPTILSVGTFKWLPNVEAVDFLTHKVWPLIKQQAPNTQLKIVGNAPTQQILNLEKKDPNITVTGRVDDIRDAFNSSHVLVAPVFSGKGTRYKILEAMASGTPIVATETAVEGLDLLNDTHVLTSNTAEGLAELTLQLLKNPQKRAELAKAGRAFVKANYDWSLIAKKLDTVYNKLGNT